MLFQQEIYPQFRDADHDGLIGLRGCMRYFQDAYERGFWSEKEPSQMEIRFLSQCREGETLSVCSREDDAGVHFAAVHQDGTLASVAFFGA